ncbi:hypothetical protein K8I61_06065 [bacterium]|nr:hypothetical protein [bacterium]
MDPKAADALREFFESFDSARGHFRNAERELLLAQHDVLEVFIRTAEKADIEILGLPLHILRALAALVEFLATLVPEAGKEAEYAESRRRAVDDLITAIETELARTRLAEPSDKREAKIEALTGLIRYLSAERDAAASAAARPRIEKIEIE